MLQDAGQMRLQPCCCGKGRSPAVNWWVRLRMTGPAGGQGLNSVELRSLAEEARVQFDVPLVNVMHGDLKYGPSRARQGQRGIAHRGTCG
eukprot:1143305-Pelagomonas_calceolata.AAC.5